MKTVEDIINDNSCFFCRQNLTNNGKNIVGDLISYDCPCCGHYKITKEAIINLQSDYKFRALATSIAQERKLAGQDDYVLQWRNIPENDNEHQICINEVPFLNNYPKDYLEKMDRILINIGRKTNYSPIIPYLPDFHDFGIFFVEPPYYFYKKEKEYIAGVNVAIYRINSTLSILIDLGWIQSPDVSKKNWPPKIYLTIEGLKHLHELQNLTENKTQAFLAMWFTNKDEYANKLNLYVDSITKAVIQAGYSTLYRVDKEKYNGYIMNRVINQIKESRFLIADLTCDEEDGMRGGVYYEAGLAAGLGMPVILTCYNETQSRVHFDLKQFNTILWDIDKDGIIRAVGHEDMDFSEYITDWIKATVGERKK